MITNTKDYLSFHIGRDDVKAGYPPHTLMLEEMVEDLSVVSHDRLRAIVLSNKPPLQTTWHLLEDGEKIGAAYELGGTEYLSYQWPIDRVKAGLWPQNNVDFYYLLGFGAGCGDFAELKKILYDFGLDEAVKIVEDAQMERLFHDLTGTKW